MFSRYFMTFFMLFLVVAVVNVKAEEEVEDDNEEQPDPRGLISNTLVKKALKVLAQTFTGAAGYCLEEAAKECKRDLFPPKKLINCARNYFKENKGACIVDDIVS